MSISWWPTTPILDDGYQLFAAANPFADPQHPAGYALIIAAIGAVTRQVAPGEKPAALARSRRGRRRRRPRPAGVRERQCRLRPRVRPRPLPRLVPVRSRRAVRRLPAVHAPRGTEFLCETRPESKRKTAYYLRGYFVPGTLPLRISSGSNGLDPQLDFTYANVYFAPTIKHNLEAYFDPFAFHTRHGSLRLLHGWQRVARFGAALLFVTTLLTLVGLVVGPRRSRVGVFLFGLGGLSLILASSFSGTYPGRYTVTMAGPLMAAAAIALHALRRRRGGGSRLDHGRSS